MGRKAIDISGKRFGKLTAIRNVGTRCNSTNIYWLCMCDCGKVVITNGSRLNTGETKSCGCERGGSGRFKRGDIPTNKGKPHPYGHKWEKGDHASPETEIKKGQHLSPKTELKSEIEKKKWANKEYKIETIKKMAKSRGKKRPTKPERDFLKLLAKYNLPIKYVGDGSRYINEFNPDFINEEQKLVIEIFGDYWHSKPDVKERDERRLRCYGDQGFVTLIVWEHELEREDLVMQRVNDFIQLA